jgi:hypothetical protein
MIFFDIVESGKLYYPAKNQITWNGKYFPFLGQKIPESRLIVIHTIAHYQE